MNTETKMTQGKPIHLLFTFALPLMFGNIFQQFYTVADTAIIGRGVGMYALAALGCIDWLCWMMTSIIQGFSQGFSIRVFQKYGEGNIAETIHRTVCYSCRHPCNPLFIAGTMYFRFSSSTYAST